MNNALILHGKPSKAKYLDPSLPKPHNANWLPWLAGRIRASGVPTEIPVFPQPYAPIYEDWRAVFEKYGVNKHTGIIAHSLGAGFIIRWLSENPDVEIEKAVLVAPWHDAEHAYGRAFFDYDIDPNLASRIGRLTIFNSSDDGPSIQHSVDMLRAAIPGISYHELEGFGHFMVGNNMQSQEFPELLAEVLT